MTAAVDAGALGRNLVAGRFIEPDGEVVEVYSPAATDVLVTRYPLAGVELVAEAAEAAADAAPSWRSTPIGIREGILFGAAERLLAREQAVALSMASEMGKPVSEAIGEVRRAAQILRFFAGELRRPLGETYLSDSPATFLYTWREPIGAVGLITPWNFPLAIPTWKAAAALAYGNTVVLKPASAAPGPAVHLAECLVDAGLPAGVLNLVTGPGGPVAGALIEHARIRAISYTGSNEVGRSIRETCARLGKRCQVELGGQNPAVVLADADLDRAAEAVAAGAFANAGQKCTSTRRLIVDAGVADELLELVRRRAAALVMGDPVDPATTLGPLVGRSSVADYEAALERAAAEGAEIVTAGVAEPRTGCFVEPAIVSGVVRGSFLARDEVFAPVLGVITHDGVDEAIELANDVRFGLSAAVFTRDLGQARRFALGFEAGIVRINAQTAGADVHVPFGGMKESGSGYREQGRAARDFYTELKTVYEDPSS